METGKAMAKGIVKGREVEVTIEGKFNENKTEVSYHGLFYVIENKDLKLIHIEDQRAEQLMYIIKENFGLESKIEGEAGIDLNVMFVSSYSHKGTEVVTIWVNAGYYVVTTNTVDESSGVVEESKNLRKIKKLVTLVKWLEKRIR